MTRPPPFMARRGRRRAATLVAGSPILVVSLLACLLSNPTILAAQLADDLIAKYEISDRDLSSLNEGKPVVKVLKVSDNRQASLMGAIRLDVSLEFFLERLDDVDLLVEGNDAMLSMGYLTPGETAASWLELPKGESESIRKCKVGKCDFKLSAKAMEAAQREIDWSRDDRDAQASTFVAALLLQDLEAYTNQGSAGLMTHNDKSEPQRAEEGLGLLLEQETLLARYNPDFHSYLASYPSGGHEGIEDVFYWSIEDFGLRPTLSLNHRTIDYLPESGR